ncbi:MAG: hypothetical protein VW495_16300 [Rhodobiaceae bacterium]
MEGLAQQFHQQIREETEALARRDELMAQFRSLQERQGKTISSPLALARHHQETGAAELARLAADARRADLVSKRREIESAMANFRAGAAEALV